MSTRLTCVTFAVMLCLAVACDRTPPADGAPEIRWGVMKNYNPVFIAQQKGFFREEGVRVVYSGTFTSGPAVVQAAAAGAIDAGHSAITAIAGARAAGVAVKGLLDSQTEFRDAPLMQWFVLADSPIRAATDLRGKRIGVNALSGSFYYTVLLYLHRAGLDPSDVQFVVVPHANQEQALKTNQIDVAGVIDPYSMHLAKSGGVRTLVRGVDVLGEKQFSLIFFRDDFVRRNPEAITRFARAYRRAVAFIESHPAEAAQLMSKAIGVPADLIPLHRYTPNASVREDDVTFWIDQMKTHGALDPRSTLRASDVAVNHLATR